MKGKEEVYDEPDNQEFLISNLSLNSCGPYTTAVGTSTINYYIECALYEASDCFIVTNPEGKYGVWNIINGTEVISCEYDEYRIIWNAVALKTIAILLLVYVKTVYGALYDQTEESAVRLSLMI